MYLALWIKKSYHFYILREGWSWTDIIVCLPLSSQTSALTNSMSLRALLGHKKPIRFIDSYLTSDSLFCFVQHSYFCNKYEWSSSSFLDLYFLFLMYSFFPGSITSLCRNELKISIIFISTSGMLLLLIIVALLQWSL